MLRRGLLIGATVAALAVTAATGRTGPAPAEAGPPDSQRYFTGSWSFTFEGVCDVFTANALSIGTASNIAGVSSAPAGCDSRPGTFFGAMTPIPTGHRMGVHWVFSNGECRHYSCDISQDMTSGSCFNRDGRRMQFTARSTANADVRGDVLGTDAR